MSASASAFVVTKLPSASYHASGFMKFSGVIWSKCLSSSCDAGPEVSRLSIATPMWKGTVLLSGVMSWTTGGAGLVTTRSSKSRSEVLPVAPPS